MPLLQHKLARVMRIRPRIDRAGILFLVLLLINIYVYIYIIIFTSKEEESSAASLSHNLLFQEVLRLVDLRGKVWRPTFVRMVCQHDSSVHFL